MGIRIQPREIDVPEDDPFKNDLLGRKESVEVLTHLVGSLEGPCVLAVDAAWGSGKTTFLRIWAQYLRNQGFGVVEFNAWETDFAGDPFVSLSTELTEGLRAYKDETLATKIDDTRKVAAEVIRRATPGLIRLLTAGILDVNPLLEKELGQALASDAEKRLSEYEETQKSVKKFRRVLQDMAGTVSKSSGDQPLIVVIDELDRCRPSYAVELLEVAKHLFSVDHIVFVLAVNRSELAHSIKALYGGDFDAAGYLRRFFDVDFRLPDPERKAFINAMLNAIRIDNYFERTKDQAARNDFEPVRNLLQEFFSSSDLSLRRIAQALYRLGLVFASLRYDQRSFFLTAVVALIVRTIDFDLYHRFVRGEVSDLEVVEKVFARPGAKTLQRKYEGYLFEATIIVSAQEKTLAQSMPPEPNSSPLLQRHKKVVATKEPENASTDPDREYSSRVIAMVKRFSNLYYSRSSGIGFRYSVQRLELLSAGLVGEAEAGHKNSS